ncbi:MAG: methylamine utilization protein MauG [Rhodospirillaceae bacterium]|nr:methylamine utilization protein MauG [Rhodospirillaceae bacterium]
MRFATSFLFVSIFMNFPVFGDWKEELLKSAAQKSGYLSPSLVNRKFDKGKAALGEIIFESKVMSLNSNMSCSTCHIDKFSSADGLPNAVGTGGRGTGMERLNSPGLIIPRNTLPLWGRGGKFFPVFFWDGKVEQKGTSIISQFGWAAPSSDPLVVSIHLPFVEVREMVDDTAHVKDEFKNENIGSAIKVQKILADRVRRNPGLLKRFLISYQLDEKEFRFSHIIDSVAHHIKNKFRLRESKFSRFVKGKGTLSRNEKEGGLLFYGKGKCGTCHQGPHFSDFKYHTIITRDLGFGKNGFGVDYGHFNVTFDPDDLYKFRTPPLHNVFDTPPYFHSGSVAKLRDAIVAHYDPLSLYDWKKMDPIRRRELYRKLASVKNPDLIPNYLDKKEIQNVIEFLKTLSFVN